MQLLDPGRADIGINPVLVGFAAVVPGDHQHKGRLIGRKLLEAVLAGPAVPVRILVIGVNAVQGFVPLHPPDILICAGSSGREKGHDICTGFQPGKVLQRKPAVRQKEDEAAFGIFSEDTCESLQIREIILAADGVGVNSKRSALTDNAFQSFRLHAGRGRRIQAQDRQPGIW